MAEKNKNHERALALVDIIREKKVIKVARLNSNEKLISKNLSLQIEVRKS